MESQSISPLNLRKEQRSRLWGDDQHAVEAFSFDGTADDVELLMTMAPIEMLSTSPQNNAMVTDSLRQSSKQGKKRPISSLRLEGDRPDKRKQLQRHPSHDSGSQEYLYFRASVPSKDSRVVNLKILNPFHDESKPRHFASRKIVILKEGETNGYVKFSLNKRNRKPTSAPYQHAFQLQHSNGFHGQFSGGQRIPKSPAGFGSNMILDHIDCLLWQFYQTAFCAGRTLLSQTNLFLVDFAAMAESDDCVRHSALSLAATYILDYTQEPQWIKRANFHHRQATKLLSQALQDEKTHEIGKEDAVVSAIIILTCDDIITWELRRDIHKTQRWLEGVRGAIQILDHSNPGYHFNNAFNIQNSAVRTSNSNLIASFDIVARPVMPLGLKDVSSNFMWLLNGTPREQSRIHGGTGVSPKLLHILSRITYFAEKLAKDPEDMIIPRAAGPIEKMLLGIRQWSELSNGFPCEQDLLEACVLDGNGLVSTAREVTDLTAQCWVSAAQIYLQCRFYRRPRSHPAIKAPLNTLLRCVERMPCAGSLFTSQSPFFPIFIMGAVSETDEERKVARHWFETVVEGLGCRSSVPPVWKALQHLWTWIDANSIEDSNVFEASIKERKAWWEQMVDMLMSTFGVLSLC